MNLNKNQIDKINVGGRGGKEGIFAPVLTEYKRVSESLYDFVHVKNNSKKIETLSTGAQVTGRFHVGTSSVLINETSMSVTAAGNVSVFKASLQRPHNTVCFLFVTVS